MGKLVDIKLDKKLFKNVDESMLTGSLAALENCFVTESKGISRFPGLKEFCNFGGSADITMNKFGTDMIAVGTDGRSFRVDDSGDFDAISGTQVLGGNRTSFAKTRDGLMMAAGSQIIKFNGVENSVLSPDAPLSSFIGYIDGYVIAVEKGSGRFQHSALNDFSSWSALNTFGVDESPDDINALLITPFNEILFSGEESIEQYERNPGAVVPFFRRWSTGDGIAEPYTLCYADNFAWGLNDEGEFSRISGQSSQNVGNDMQKEFDYRYGLGNIGSLNKAWASPIFIKGQKFIVFQSPEATNSYGTSGFTAIFDIRQRRWFEIFGWNAELGVPDLWKGRSVFRMFGKTFIGGEGKIYQLDPDTYNNDNEIQRAYVRTAHFDSLGSSRIDKVRMTLKRGVGSYTENPKITFRANPDNRGFNNIQTRDLGNTADGDMIIEFGSQGIADTWQFEWSVTDNVEFELRRLQVEATKIER